MTRKPECLRLPPGWASPRNVHNALPEPPAQDPPRTTRGSSLPGEVSFAGSYLFRHHSQTLPAMSSAWYGEAPWG